VDFPQGDNELAPFRLERLQLPPLPLRGASARGAPVPGGARTHSSRIHIVDTKPDPRNPRLVKVIEGSEVHAKTGYAAPHTVHCGPDGIYLNALGAPTAGDPAGSSCSITRPSR